MRKATLFFACCMTLSLMAVVSCAQQDKSKRPNPPRVTFQLDFQ